MTDSLIAEINKMIAQINKGVVKGQEAGDFFAGSIRKAKEMYGQNSDEWRLLDRWEHENGYQWHPVYKSERYASEKEKQKLQDLKLKLEEISGDGNKGSFDQDEYTFTANQRYEAYKTLIHLLKSAERSIVIVDNFLDEIVFDFLDIIPVTISVRMITSDRKPIFRRLFLALKEKGETNIEAKVNTTSHDRYLVVDDLNVYSLGASLNTIGKGDFMIHRLNEQTDIVLKKVEQWWVEGTIISQAPQQKN